MFSCMIDSKEDMDVATTEISRDFLQTDDTSGITHLKFDGIMAELLFCIDSYIYRKYITYEKYCNIFLMDT